MRFVASFLCRTCPRSFAILQTHSSTDSGPGDAVDTVGATAVCSPAPSIFRPAATALCPPRIATAATAPPSQPAACGMLGGRKSPGPRPLPDGPRGERDPLDVALPPAPPPAANGPAGAVFEEA